MMFPLHSGTPVRPSKIMSVAHQTKIGGLTISRQRGPNFGPQILRSQSLSKIICIQHIRTYAGAGVGSIQVKGKIIHPCSTHHSLHFGT